MKPHIRSMLGVVAGVIVGGLVIMAIEALNSVLFPLPAGVDIADRQALSAAIADAGPHVLIGVLVAWALGTFIGAWVAVRIGARGPRLHAVLVGLILLALAVVNMLAIPHPTWFWIVGVLLFIPAALLGARAARSRSDRGAEATA